MEPDVLTRQETFRLLLAAAAPAALAQGDPPPAADAATPQTIVVTGERRADDDYQASRARSATKTDTPLLDTPQAIVVVPRAVIDDQGGRDLHDAARNVSGVSRQSSYWGQNNGSFRVRGFDLDEGSGYLRDGFRYFARGSVFMPNVAAVEILKGPASVLYGRVEPGGLANLVSEQPSRRAARWIEARAARFDQYALAGGGTGPLDEAGRWLYRVDAEVEDGKSFRDRVYNRRAGLAPQLVWQPDDATKVRAYLEFQWQDLLSDYGIPAWQGKPADVPISWYYGEPFNRQVSRQSRALLSLERRLADGWSLRTAVSSSTYRYADGYDEAYSAWTGDFGPDGTGESDGIPRVYRFWGRFPERHGRHYVQAELLGRGQWLGLPQQWLFGAELGRQDSRSADAAFSSYPSLLIFDPQPLGDYQPQPDTVSYDYGIRDDLGALYVQNEVELGESLRLLLGARWDRYRQRYRYVSSDGFDQLGTSSDDAVSPRAGLLFKLTPSVSLYASVARSFAPAGAYYAADQGRRFKPLVGTQHELGAKWESEDGRWTASAALYDLSKRNVVTPDPDDARFSIQVGEERSTGFELDVAAQPWAGVNVIASYARMHARISESNDYPVGNRLPFAPRHSGSLWLSWRLPEALLGAPGWQVGAGAFAQGARAGDLENSVTLPGYVRWDASLGWRGAGWQVQLVVENVTDRIYFDSGTGSGTGVIYPGAPRSASLTVRHQW
jgi:iron complex outermembrane recepter protein